VPPEQMLFKTELPPSAAMDNYNEYWQRVTSCLERLCVLKEP